MHLTDFTIIRPPLETTQEASLDWFVEGHTEAEKKKGNLDPTFREKIREKIWHVGCKPDRIAKRGHILTDYLHRNWDQMKIYAVSESSPNGHNLSVRLKYYEEYADQVLEQYYPETAIPPEDLIHATCTGYVSPSAAQKIASKRHWGSKTTITHAYHMGCYASSPCIRMATGFLASTDTRRADIVHTEICSLHSDLSNHNLDQLVSQSLFADGFIKYSVMKDVKGPHLKVIAIVEELIPDSLQAMTWNVSYWGFQMSLAKEVPVLIIRALKTYLQRLAEKAKIDSENLLSKALFAIHPGGPKILVNIQDRLNLSDRQMAHSFDILKNYGNMSSATLPHIWEAILSDEDIPNSTPIVSLAFGPGLSITGSIMEKRCGS